MSLLKSIRKPFRFLAGVVDRNRRAFSNYANIPTRASDDIFYGKALKDMLGKSQDAVMWHPKGVETAGFNLKGKSPQELIALMKREGGNIIEDLSVSPKQVAGDYIVDPLDALLSKHNIIEGSTGQGLPSSILHEMGHVMNSQKRPGMVLRSAYENVAQTGNHPKSSYKAIENAFDKGILGNMAVGIPTGGASVSDEFLASLYGYKALKRSGAPFRTKMDYMKHVIPPGLSHLFTNVQF